jgi:arylsulfatase A-like enzyme
MSNSLLRTYAVLTLGIALAPSTALAQQTKRPPNAVVILVDDLGWSDLSCQGSKLYKTPNIDKLASMGMRFTNGYAAAAVCSPTRAALLTGREPARLGLTDWIRPRWQRPGKNTPAQNPTEYVGGPKQKLLCPPNPFWMELAEVTLAEVLKAIGYVTGFIGKWHLGDPDYFPEKQGFDFNLGGCDFGQPPSYFDPYVNPELPGGIPTLPPRRKGEYLTDREADEAVSFIHAHKDKPFFLMLAHYAVHTPLQAKPNVIANYKGKQADGQKNATYAAMVESVDDACGAVVKALLDAGILEQTIVIFTSDNGGLLGSTINLLLRLGKGHAYEGGLRVPWIISWSGVTPPGSTSNEPIISMDLFPSLVEATGASLPKGKEIDGVSLVKHLKSGGKEPLQRETLYWHFPHYREVPGPYSVIRAGDWKLIKFYEEPVLELYNLKDDLGETNNLAGKMPSKVQQLHQQLKAHLQAVGAKLPRPNPNYQGVKKLPTPSAPIRPLFMPLDGLLDHWREPFSNSWQFPVGRPFAKGRDAATLQGAGAPGRGAMVEGRRDRHDG